MKRLSVLSLAVVVLSAAGLWAEDPKPKETFHVFARDCKSLLFESSHDSMAQASWAAYKRRNDKDNPPNEVRIVVGAKTTVGEVEAYELWRNQCKDAWAKKGTFKTEKEALAAAAVARKEGDSAEVVWRMKGTK